MCLHFSIGGFNDTANVSITDFHHRVTIAKQLVGLHYKRQLIFAGYQRYQSLVAQLDSLLHFSYLVLCELVFIERIALSIKTFNTYRYLTKYTHSYRLQDMKKTTLSERLNIAMQKRGMTQGALAKASGVAQPTIWRLTSGGAKASRKVVDIANALKVSVDWLANGDGEMEDDGKEYRVPAHSKASPSGMFPVNIWDKDNELDGVVFVPEAVKSDSCRAYILEKIAAVQKPQQEQSL